MVKPPPDPIYTLRGNMDIIHCLLFRRRESGDYLYVGTNSGFVHIWELTDYRETGKIIVGASGCLSIAYQPDVYMTQEKGGCLKLWTEEDNFLNWKLIRIINVDYVGFCKSVFIDGIIISAVTNSKIKLLHLNSEKIGELQLNSGNTKVGEVMCLKYLLSTKEIITAYESGDVAIWDIENISREKSRTSLTSDQPMAMDFSENSKEGVLGLSSEIIIKFVFSEGKLNKVRETKITNPGVSSICIRSDGKICVLGCWDGRVRYFTMKTLKLLAVLDYHKEAVDCVLFSKFRSKCVQSEIMAAGGKDGRITLWSLYSS